MNSIHTSAIKTVTDPADNALLPRSSAQTMRHTDAMLVSREYTQHLEVIIQSADNIADTDAERRRALSTVKPVFKYQPPVDKDDFAQSTCLLTISVGQEVHEGNKFEAAIDLVNTSFGNCIMLVDDSLQRHSMALDKPQDANFFYEASTAAGDAWLLRNAQYYGKLDNLINVIRWDRWLQHPCYLRQRAIIEALLSVDADYQASFTTTIDEFLRRYHARLLAQTGFDVARARALCFEYLLEECAALSLWPELRCRFEVYPGKRNLAMQATHERLVVPAYGDILYPIAIKFKNRKQLKAQQFSCQSVSTEATPMPQES